jgi:hypothetical protein
VFFVYETNSKLEMRDLVDPVICQCRKWFKRHEFWKSTAPLKSIGALLL